MTSFNNNEDNFFEQLNIKVDINSLPDKFSSPFNSQPHPICLAAVKQLQHHLTIQSNWEHNFGLSNKNTGPVIGKMFGVLVVKNSSNLMGYLSAFSGKLAGGNVHPKFVPPVYDALTEGSFLNIGMQELTSINKKIEALNEEEAGEIKKLKEIRKSHSITLQEKLFDHYHFINKYGEEKSLMDIFHNKPPSGAGECTAPKLLQYAFQNNMQPIAIAEFWWGLSPKSNQWKHGHFYPACDEKCGPILAFMLKGILLS